MSRRAARTVAPDPRRLPGDRRHDASRRPEASAAIEVRRVVDGLNAPVAFTFGPGRKIWYVEKNTGEIRIYNRATGGTACSSRSPA